MGRRLNQNEALDLCQSGITAVLDLSAELAEVRAFRRLCYLCVPVLDLTAPSGEQLDRMARFIASEAENGRVYVHCKIGFSRSAAAVAAYLVHSKQAESAGDAFAMIREKRPSVVISTATFKALEEFGLRSKSSAGSDAFLLASAPVCGP
jgi:protein-tyrosine phosphatase